MKESVQQGPHQHRRARLKVRHMFLIRDLSKLVAATLTVARYFIVGFNGVHKEILVWCEVRITPSRCHFVKLFTPNKKVLFPQLVKTMNFMSGEYHKSS